MIVGKSNFYNFLINDKFLSKFNTYKGQIFSEEESSIIIKSLAEAVEYLHSQEIVHRDIKPENIIFDNAKKLNSLKIIDFGLSSQFFESKGDYEFCGTLLYMAPEQIEKRIYTKAIDIWSCGVILYQLLNNGFHPFHNKDDSYELFLEKLKGGKWKNEFNISR